MCLASMRRSFKHIESCEFSMYPIGKKASFKCPCSFRSMFCFKSSPASYFVYASSDGSGESGHDSGHKAFELAILHCFYIEMFTQTFRLLSYHDDNLCSF